MTPELVVLDLDGTLVRLPVDWAALRSRLRAELRRLGRPAPERGVLSTLDALEEAGDREAHAACAAIVEEAEASAAAVAPVNAALLRRLPPARTAILSLNSRRAVLAALHRPGMPQPEAIVAREDGPPRKPDPAGLRWILERTGVAPARALMVGDAPSDLDCARAAGVPALDVAKIGVEWVPVKTRAPGPITGP